MRISPRNRLILVAVALALLAIVAAVLLIVPQARTLATINQQITTAAREVDEARALLQQRQEMKDRAAQTDAAYLRLANQVPETPELPSLIIELQDVALQSGVDFESLRPGDPVTSTQGTVGTAQTVAPTSSTAEYIIIPLQVSIRGTWSDTIDFMGRLHKMTRALRIVEFSATTRTASQTQQEQTASTKTTEFTNFRLEAYTVPASTTSTTTAAPAAQ